MIRNIHGCKEDREAELAAEAEEKLCDAGECAGYPLCDWCVLARQSGEDSLGG